MRHIAPIDHVLNAEGAMRIASHWQSPGTEGIGMAQFASTGTITEALLDDLDREIIALDGSMSGERGDNLAELRALKSYVMASEARVWVVGHNIAGYSPESDVHAHLDYADAVDAYVDMLKEIPESISDECGCVEGTDEFTEDETCEGCTAAAHVAAFIKDEVPTTVRGMVFGGVRELCFVHRPDSLPLPTVYWLAESTRVVADYVAETA